MVRLGLRELEKSCKDPSNGNQSDAYCAERSTLGEGGLVGLGILVVFIPVTVASNDESTEHVFHVV